MVASKMPKRGTRTSDSVLGVFGTAPSYESFYSLFERAGTNVEQATALLLTLMADWPDDGPRLRLELKQLETDGDRITHDVIHHLNVKAATPFPGADAHELISEVDDIVDLAEEVGDFMGLYRIEAATEQAIALAEVLHGAGREVAAALGSLREPHQLRAHVDHPLRPRARGRPPGAGRAEPRSSTAESTPWS